jgi:hypothetical protein
VWSSSPVTSVRQESIYTSSRLQEFNLAKPVPSKTARNVSITISTVVTVSKGLQLIKHLENAKNLPSMDAIT